MPRIEIELPEEYIFSTDIPVRISDINRGRHLGHDAILPMMEEARVRFLSSLGFTESDIDGAAFILVDAGIVYKKQGYYGQTLTIDLAVTDLSSRGCDIVYRISDRETGDEMFRAKTGMLFYNYEKQKVVPMPEGFRAKVSGRAGTGQ